MPSAVTHEQIRRKNLRRAGRMRWPEERTWPDEVDELLEETRSPDPAVRREVLHRLCPCTLKANDARAWDRILQMVADPDPKVRAQVLHTPADGSPRERSTPWLTVTADGSASNSGAFRSISLRSRAPPGRAVCPPRSGGRGAEGRRYDHV